MWPGHYHGQLQLILICGIIASVIHRVDPMSVMFRIVLSALDFCVLTATSVSHAADPLEVKLVIRNHRFEPTELKVPAGQKIKLVVENQDPTPEEFESYSLNREKIVPGKGKITVLIGPLKPGKYEFFGEFNMDTATGFVVAQ